MKSHYLLLAAAAATFSVPALANEPRSEASEDANKPKAEEKICKRVALDTGSRRKERLCLTAQEWRDLNNPL